MIYREDIKEAVSALTEFVLSIEPLSSFFPCKPKTKPKTRSSKRRTPRP